MEDPAPAEPAPEPMEAAPEGGEAEPGAEAAPMEVAPADQLEEAEAKKALGKAAFEAKNFSEAARHYGEAIAAAGDAVPAVYYSNRAVCRALLGDFAGACEDAVGALSKPDGVTKKTLFQKVRAEIHLNREADARETLRLAEEHGLRPEVEKQLREAGVQLPPTAAAASAPPKAQEPAGDAAAAAKEAGTARYKEGAYREALVEYNRALDLLPAEDVERRVPLLGNVAAALLMLRRVGECCSTCEKALALDPTNSKIRARLVTAQVARGDFELARSSLAAAGNGEDPALTTALRQLEETEQKFAAANKTLENGEAGRALSLYAELESKALSDSPALALKMARCYLELKNFPRVLNTTQQVLRANPQSIDALVLRTEALYRNNMTGVDSPQWSEPLEQGQKLLKEALSFDPDHKVAQALRKRLRQLCTKQVEMRAQMDSREFEKARETMDSMMADAPDNPALLARLHCERARASIRLKDWRQVLKDVGQATYRDHELVQAYLYRAQALQSLDRHDDAVKELEGLFQWHREQGVYEKLMEAKFLLRKQKRPNYYEILQCPSVASQLEIKKAYRERAAEWHPDKKGHLDEAARKNAEAMFKRIGEAYEVLTSDVKKELYDKGYDLEGIEEQIEIKKRRTERNGNGCCGGGCR